MIDRDGLIEQIARRLWFETVDAEGYPNGMMTWDEMVSAGKTEITDENRRFVLDTIRTLTLYLSMAQGALEVVEHSTKEEKANGI